MRVGKSPDSLSDYQGFLLCKLLFMCARVQLAHTHTYNQSENGSLAARSFVSCLREAGLCFFPVLQRISPRVSAVREIEEVFDIGLREIEGLQNAHQWRFRRHGRFGRAPSARKTLPICPGMWETRCRFEAWQPSPPATCYYQAPARLRGSARCYAPSHTGGPQCLAHPRRAPRERLQLLLFPICHRDLSPIATLKHWHGTHPLPINLIPTVCAFIPMAYSSKTGHAHHTTPHHRAYTIVSHPHHSPLPQPHARNTLPDKQCVPPVFSHQRFTIATGN